MDFILSLAHFCELHGPTSVLCTQALSASCALCRAPTSSSPELASKCERGNAFLHRPQEWVKSPRASVNTTDEDRCESCRMTLPEDFRSCVFPNAGSAEGKAEPTTLRTREEVHVCDYLALEHTEAEDLGHHCTGSCEELHSELHCHSHALDYISSPSPKAPESFSGLRRAIVRTLSGEQLPRGRKSGPLWFGDSSNGYTIAYLFGLQDLHARGRRRYYALVALAGTDTQRALEACTPVWSLFEEVVMNITSMASRVQSLAGSASSPLVLSQVPPVSSLLTGRLSGVNRFAPSGLTRLQEHGIAALVDNENFFCELHVTFVALLQTLGKILGGIMARSHASKSISGLRWQESNLWRRPNTQRSAGDCSGNSSTRGVDMAVNQDHGKIANHLPQGSTTQPSNTCQPSQGRQITCMPSANVAAVRSEVTV